MVKIGAHVKYKFDKGFLFDEENLRKINDIISKRITDTIEYLVSREDSYSYKTINLEDIIIEDNLKWEKINEIEISVGNEHFLLSLEFNEKGTNLQINGDNRDDVFLLFSELKEYLSNEVCTKKITSKFISNAIPIASISILFGILIAQMLISVRVPNIDGYVVSDLLQSTDINEKINYLIQSGTKSNYNTSNILFVAAAPILFLVMAFRESFTKCIFYFYPTNLFLFGKEIDRYKKRLDMRSKLFWIICMGILVSIVGGLFVWKIIPN